MPPAVEMWGLLGGPMVERWLRCKRPMSVMSPALGGEFFTTKAPRETTKLWWSSGKGSTCQAGDAGMIPGLGRFPGERNGNPLQYSCLENPMERGACRATVYGVTKELHTT